MSTTVGKALSYLSSNTDIDLLHKYSHSFYPLTLPRSRKDVVVKALDPAMQAGLRYETQQGLKHWVEMLGFMLQPNLRTFLFFCHGKTR